MPSAQTRQADAPGRPVAFLRHEAVLTVRLVADNVTTTILPATLFTAASAGYHRVGGAELALDLVGALLVFGLYLYVFDASNQARPGAEDRINKPHRPIPSGMVTHRGLLIRFWLTMPVYTILGLLFGIVEWVLLWQAIVIVLNLLSVPRHYLFVKPVTILAGTIAQLAAAWQLAGPLDPVGWSWILVIGVGFTLALPFEDVRDMAGDRAIGRRTLALTVGPWPVRVAFAIVMTAFPIGVFLLLFQHSPAGPASVAVCTVAVTALSWTAAARSLLLHTVRADRHTYLLYSAVYCAVLASAVPLLR